MHKPIQAKFHEALNSLMASIDKQFNPAGGPRETGIVMLVFPFGETDEKRCNYISNGMDRKDMAVLFREMAARFEGQPHITGHG